MTFPKSLHAGFSYGFNCAEAVNFSPPAWLPFGREAVERYRKFGRNPVFSHERLVLTLAAPANLSADWSEASIRALLRELTAIVTEEERRRRDLRARGVRFDVVGRDKLPPNRLAFVDGASLDYDEKRVCLRCRHVCFLSAVACECDALNVTCLKDVAALCGCGMERRYLLAWHDMAELWAMVEGVDRFLQERVRRSSDTQQQRTQAHEESKAAVKQDKEAAFKAEPEPGWERDYEEEDEDGEASAAGVKSE